MVSGMLRFPADQTHKRVAQPQWCKHKAIPVFRLRIAGKHIKYGGRILSDRFRTRQNATVRVQLCRRIVVISGAKMDIAANAILLSSHDKRNLAVCFQSKQTVNNVTACLFQHFCPDNIVFLIKACFQFD